MSKRLMTSGPGFSEERAARALQFISNLTHTKDQWAGQPFNPRPWQQAMIREFYGRMRADDPTRRAYRTAYWSFPRKNGKSELAAGLALYGLVGDGVKGAEVYSAAADREQAKQVYNVAAQMVRNDERLSARLTVLESQSRIVDHSTHSFYKAISAEAYSKHGFNASMVIYDELHAAPGRDLWDVMATSMGARREPQLIAITTAGWDRHSICWEQYSYGKKILDGAIEDPTFYPVIYEAAPDAPWDDLETAKACNPAAGDFRDIDELLAMIHRAREIPALQNVYRRLYLNQWTEQAERWIDMDAWGACRGAFDWRELREAKKGKACYAGLDLSSRNDLSALVLIFEDDSVVPFFWVPEEGAERRARVDRVPYPQWARDGLITKTPGAVVDQEYILKDIAGTIGKAYKIREIGFDPWNATWLCQALRDQAGFSVVDVRQGFASLSEATKEIGASVTGRALQHGDHPVLRWNASNMVVRQDANGNLAPDKSKITERIDGMSALITAKAVQLKAVEVKPPTPRVLVLGMR